MSDACKKLHKRLQDFLDELVKKGNFDRYWGKQKTLLSQWKSGNKSWKGFWPEVCDSGLRYGILACMRYGMLLA